MSFNIRSLLGISPADAGNTNRSDSSGSRAVSHSPTTSVSVNTRGSAPPSTAASSTTRSTPSGSTAAPGNVHATLSCGQNSRLFTNVFQSSGLRTQNGGYHFTPGPSTQVYNGPAQGSGMGLTPQQWTWDPLLALQSASASSGTPNFVPLPSKRMNQADNAPGPSKKPRYFDTQVVITSSSDTESDDEDEDLAEPFDPRTFYSNSSKKKLPESLEKYVQTHFRSCLSNPVRKAMAKERPLPNSVALKCLEADDAIVDFMGKSFPTKVDKQYKRMQTAVITAAAPALCLWKELEEQGFTSGQGGLMPVDTVLDTLQRSIVLIGNASNYVSQVRRDVIIRKLESNNKGLAVALKSTCKKHQPEEDLLFGSQVRKALNERAQTLDSFKKVASKVSQPQSTPRSSWKEKKFFRDSPARDHGHGSGRIFRPSNQQFNQQRNRRPNFHRQKFTPKNNSSQQQN